MKIIDLLNKIANGEEVPNKIKVFGYIFVYTEDKRPQRFYKMENQDNYLFRDFVYTLNGEVEIIEEPQEHKIPEKLNIYNFPRHNNSLKKTAIKINEIIDYLEEIENE